MKQCKDCRLEKSSLEFCNNSSSKDGLNTYCRSCAAERKKAYASIPKLVPDSKECSACRVSKSSSEFHKSGSTKDGLSLLCKPCQSALFARKVRVLASVEQKLCKVCRLVKSRAEFHANSVRKDGLASECRGCASDRIKEYRVGNEHVYSANSRNYRARKRNADCRHWDPETFDRVHKELELKRRRLEMETGIVHHLDHIVPIKGKNVCGLHVWYNWQILDGPANMSKGNRFE